MMIISAGQSPFFYDFLFSFFLFFMHAALDGLLSKAQWQKAVVGPQVGLRPTERKEGLVDRWMGVTEPVEPLQFAYLNEVSDNRDIFKKNIKME